MKIEIFVLPRNGEVRMLPTEVPAPATETEAQPPKAVRPVTWKFSLWVPLLAFALVFCGGAAYAGYRVISLLNELSRQTTAASPSQNAALAFAAIPDKSRVRHVDSSHSLRRGDVVVVRQETAATVGQIQMAARSSGLMRRGNAVEALYVLGDDRYLVASENGARVVRGGEIIAIVDPAAQQ